MSNHGGGGYPPQQPQQPQQQPQNQPQQQQQPQQPMPPLTHQPPPRPPAVQTSTPQMQQQQQQPSHQPYQLTHAQLSPAVGTTTEEPAPAPGTDHPTASLERRVTSTLQRLFTSKTNKTDGRNVGFSLTSKLAQQHQATSIAAAQQPHARPLAMFQVTKLRSWRTGYVRLLALYPDYFCTLDPSSAETTETNRWNYSDLTEWLALPKEPGTLLLQINKDTLKLSCHNVARSRVLIHLLECQHWAGHARDVVVFGKVQRHSRHGTTTPVSLQVTGYGLVEQHPTTKAVLRAYHYSEITGVSICSDDEAAIVLHFGNMHDGKKLKSRLYSIYSGRTASSGRSDLVTLLSQHYETLGLEPLTMHSSMTVPQWLQQRRSMDIGPVATQWAVSKTTRRHDSRCVGGGDASDQHQGWVGGIVQRQLALTNGLVVERDAAGIVSCRRLADLHALVRSSQGDQLTLEYENGQSRTYTSSRRDALLVSILDAAATLGHNVHVHVTDVPSTGYRVLSTTSSESETASMAASSIFQPISIPQYCLGRVYALSTQAYAYVSGEFEQLTSENQEIDVVQQSLGVLEACREFNASVLPSGEGLPTGANDKHISGSIGALYGLVAKLLTRLHSNPQQSSSSANTNARERLVAEQSACAMFQTLYRLSGTVTGYKVSVELTTMQETIPLLWKIDDVFTKFWGFQVIKVLMSGLPQRDLEAEYVNKSVILRTGGVDLVHGFVDALLEPSNARAADGRQHVSDLILMVASDILQGLLCSYHDTTTPDQFGLFINALAEKHRALLSTLRSPTPFVIENTALLLHLLSTHAPQAAAAIRDAALSSAILLYHFHAAIFSPLEGQRFLSRYLCSLWLSGPMDCDEKRLLKRMVPSGFLAYLRMPALSRMEEEQLDELERDAVEQNIPDQSQDASKGEDSFLSSMRAVMERGAAGTNMSRLRARINIADATASSMSSRRPKENFRIFFHVLTKDHSLPDLIWSQQTRRELRVALETEIQFISREVEARGVDAIAWNHQQFQVKYPSLENEVKVGNVYMRLWLQAGDGFIRSWDEPVRLFELLFRRFLCEIDRDAKVTIMCIRCLERLYAMHASDIGPFTDVMILVRSMASTKSIETQHRLLGLLATLLGVSSEEGVGAGADIPENAEQLLNKESIGQLCQFVAWGHTNEIQVGNILTRVLSPNAIGRSLITDGTSAGPGGADASSPSQAAPDASCPAVWFVASTGRIPPPSESIKGPFRISDLMTMLQKGDLSPFDLVTASHVEEYDTDSTSDDVRESQIDTGNWKRLNQVWQLRWQLCTDGDGKGIFPPSDVALLASKALTRLVDLHRSLDSRGVPYFPIPTAKRILSGLSRDAVDGSDSKSLSFLSILCQALLCNDGRVVDQAAELLYKVTAYNEEATAKLYLTGVYFFACCYTGSNFRSLSKLMHATHLKQHFRSGFTAAAHKNELSVKDRSILGQMLPEGLILILTNYGFERFAEVFVSNVDTPEVIWTFDMRKHLIEMIQQHLGDFPLRLYQNTTTEYEYCPIPGVAFKRLEKEMFCHNYYLHNLCDEERFPDWPIAEPVEVFRACLERFKKQVDRDETKEEAALEDARKTLRLDAGDGSKELRKAYRSLARQYHPDKNPAGREMFEAIQISYELLLPIVESGEKIRVFLPDVDACEDSIGTGQNSERFYVGEGQVETMLLLIKTQLLICRRFEKEMSRYKYPAYAILLECIRVPPACLQALEDGDPSKLLDSGLVKQRRADFIRCAAELLFRTCLVSPLNAEELVIESGVVVLDSLLDVYMKVPAAISKCTPTSQKDKRASEVVFYDIISHVIHTLSGVAFFENGRTSIKALEDPSRLLINWRRCIDGTLWDKSNTKSLDTPIKIFALEGIANMAQDSVLQGYLIGCGIVWPLIRLMLMYDPTLETSASSHGAQDDTGMSVMSSNMQARLAARALGMLSGALEEAPRNEALTEALNTLLTAPVARMLRNKRTGEILRVMNSNVEKADIIWNVSMRQQLEGLLKKVEKERPDDVSRTVEDELASLGEFEYEALRGELQIGEVYVRVFNKTGKEALSYIQNSTAFGEAIIRFVAMSLNNSAVFGEDWKRIPLGDETTSSDGAPPVDLNDSAFMLAIHALRILARVDGLIDDVLCEPSSSVPSVLLSLLELPVDSEVFDVGCDILSTMSPKQSFADAVARQGVLWRLLSILERPEQHEGAGDTADVGDVSARLIETTTQQKARGWLVLEALSSSPSIATKLVSSTGWIELLGVLVGYSGFTRVFAARTGAAKTLSRLLWDPVTGPSAAPLIERFLPTTLTVVLKEDPEAMLKKFDGDSDTPELIWDSSMRAQLRKTLGAELDECIRKRKETGDDTFSLKPGVSVKYEQLESELYVGGVYVSRFLKEPTFNLRDPTTFLELLLQRWSKEIDLYISSDERGETSDASAITEAGQDVLQLVTTAIVYLCKVRDSLCDKLAQWGYMSRFLTVLPEILEKELAGAPLMSVMRILHVAANRMVNVESLAVCGRGDGKRGIVDYTETAIGSDPLHKDTAFMIELLKKVYVTALGDLKKARQVRQAQRPASVTPMDQQGIAQSFAMAPSPAPGDDPVRKRVNIGDDPLAFMGAPPPSQAQPTPPQQNWQQPQMQQQAEPREQMQLQQQQQQQQTERRDYQQQNRPQYSQPQPPPQRAQPYQQEARPTPTPQQSYQQRSQAIPYAYPPPAPQQNQQYPYPQANQTSRYQQPMSQQRYDSQQGQPSQTQPRQYESLQPLPTPTPTPTQSYQHPSSFQQQTQSGQRQGYDQQNFQRRPQDERDRGQTSQPQPQVKSQSYEQRAQTLRYGLPPQPAHYQQQAHQQQAQTYSQLPNYQQAPFPTQPSLQQPMQRDERQAGQQPAQSYAQHQQSQQLPQPQGSAHIQTQGYAPQTQQTDYRYQQQPAPNQSQQHDNSQPFVSGAGSQPIVETVSEQEPPQTPQYRPVPIEGSGVDARSKEDPKVTAEQQSMSIDGAPGSAQGRVALLQEALVCKLCEFLVDGVLENPTLKDIRDPATAKVNAIELLKLLTKDPGYGPKFKLILDSLPAWKKYKSQDHSLLVTQTEQKIDYFLTDGGTGETKLLTHE